MASGYQGAPSTSGTLDQACSNLGSCSCSTPNLPLGQTGEGKSEGVGYLLLTFSVRLSRFRPCGHALPQQNHARQQSDPQALHQRAVHCLATRLLQTAKNSQLDPDSLRIYLRGLRRRYEAELQAAEVAGSMDTGD
ncbi:hypothetical protein GJAV_G00013630 [Gymnothorax javanicus]|nr:hypothetical protein GJAV_G00013630 [Gymnothorax javanicus]